LTRLLNIFNRMFCAVPLAMALIFSLIYTFGGWGFLSEKYVPEHFMLPVLPGIFRLAALALVVVLTIYICNKRSGEQKKQIKNGIDVRCKDLLLVFAATLVIRLTIILLLKNSVEPYSDFARTWNLALGETAGNLEYYTLFPTYLNFAVLESSIVSMLGKEYCWMLVINAVFCGITSVGIVLIANNLGLPEREAVTAGFVYVFMPSNIAYTLAGTPDFITIAFDTYGILCLIKFIKYSEDDFSFRKMCMAMMSAILLGIGASYKSFAVIILIAFAIAYCARAVTKPSGRLHREKVNEAVAAIMIIAVMLIGYKATTKLILSITEKIYTVELDTSYSTPHFLLVGLNTEGEGQIHLGNLSRKYAERYLSNGYDQKDAERYAYVLLKEDWKNNKAQVPKLFIKKMVWAWQDDAIPVMYLTRELTCLENVPEEENNTIIILAGVAQLYYIALLGFSLIGTEEYIRRRDMNYGMEFVLLTIFGYYCLLFLSEAQSRYKCLITPYLCILAAMGTGKILHPVTEREKTK